MTARQTLQRHIAMRARVKGAPMKCGVCREPLRFEAGKGYVHVIKCHVRDHLAMPRRT
jgi:hypothetical protein